MKKRKQKKSTSLLLLEEINYWYVFLMLLVFPLFYNNNFIDIVRSKLAFYKVVTFIFAGFAVLGMIAVGIEGRKDKEPKGKAAVPKKIIFAGIPKDMLFTGIFAAAILLSTVFSEYRKEAWLGTEGRRLGAMIMLLYLFVYLVTGRYLQMKKSLLWAFLASNTVVILLGILDFWGLDILHMYDNLASNQHTVFISTIGNVNVNAGYLCLILPVVMVLYFLCEDWRMRLVYGVFLGLGFYEGYATVSESWLLGIGIAYFVLFGFACKSHGQMLRFLEVFGIFYLSSLMMRITLTIGSAAQVSSPMFLFFQNLTLQNFITNWFVLIAAGILLAVCFLVFGKARQKNAVIPYLLIRKWFYIVFAVLAAAGILVILIANVKGEGQWEGALGLLNQLQLTDSFGSNRGYIWKRTVTAYGKLPWYQKIFGYGLNCFKQFISVDYGAEMTQLYAGTFIDAHNEFLQFLVTTGIVGVIGYFGIFISTAVSCAKKAADKPILMAGTVMVCGFLAQGMVNNPQTFITPSAFLFLGILKSMEHKAD